MRFSAKTVSVWMTAVGGVAWSAGCASAFATSGPAFVSRSVAGSAAAVSVTHKAGCSCPACSRMHQPGCACPACMSAFHPATCSCLACASRVQTRLFADATEEAVAEDAAAEDDTPAVEAAAEEVAGEEAVPVVEAVAEDAVAVEEAVAEGAAAVDEAVPAEVEAMDGIESQDEAHNAERNSRGSLKKHKREPKGKALSELEVGAQVTGTVKKIASYGAFVDIGAQSDGLLHISRMAEDFVQDVNDLLKEGEPVDVRIAAVDTAKNQISLSMITEEAENRTKQSQPQQRGGGGGGGGRRDFSAVLGQLQEKGWDKDAFVEGEVERTLDFGAFVKIDSSLLNSEVEGNMDGLVHISALSVGRVDSVSDVVKPGDKVQVRVKGISEGKVSLSMIDAADEQPRRGRGGNREQVFEGAKDWKESLEKIQGTMPTFQNLPVVIDTRKGEPEPVAEEAA